MGLQTFSSGNFNADAQTYIANTLLSRAKRDLVVYGLGKKEKLPSRYSTTFQYTRFEKLNLPQAALTEGVTPSSGSDLVISTVQCTMDQWGDFVQISDVADLTVKHPLMDQAITLMAEQASETIDREVIKVLQANTKVFYPGAVAARGSLAATDYMNTDLVRKAIANLRGAGAQGYEGRMFVGLINPSVEMDITADTTFVNAASYQNIMVLQAGEVGKWMGVRWVVSNLLPKLDRLASVTTASSATAGSLVAATTYYIKVARVSNDLGFEDAVTVEQSQATGAGQTSLNVTMPAASGYKYNVYIGSTSGGALYKVASLQAPSAVVNVGTLPTSGAVAPATPASGVTVHMSWLLGKESFAVPELMSLQTFMTPRQASDSDPLLQRRKASWKVMFKAVICNEAFLARLETASKF